MAEIANIKKSISSKATLAQLVERLIRNQQVAGSIPAGGSRSSNLPPSAYKSLTS